MNIRCMILLSMVGSVFGLQLPMIQSDRRLSELLYYVDKNKALKIGAAAIGGHGMTDFFTKHPTQLVVGYLFGFTLTYVSPVELRYSWLVLGSTYHFSKDMICLLYTSPSPRD